MSVRKAEANPHVLGAAPYVEESALLHGRRISGAVVQRRDARSAVARFPTSASKMVRGKLDDLKPGKFGIVLGNELAMELGVDVGDKVTVYTPDVNVTPVGAMPRLQALRGRRHLFGGIRRNTTKASRVMHMDDAEQLFQTDGPTGIRLQARRHVPRVADPRVLAAEASGQYYRDAGLGTGPREFLQRGVDGKDGDVHHPVADRRRGRVQSRLHADDAGHRQAGRHRDPAHARHFAGQRHGHLHGAGHDRRHISAFLLGVVGGVLLAMEYSGRW